MAKKKTKRKTTKTSIRKAKGHNVKGDSNPFSPFKIFFMLGLASFVGLVFMVVIFVSERAGTMPWLGLTYIESITDAENMLFFVASVIFAFFLAFFILSLMFNFIRRRD